MAAELPCAAADTLSRACCAALAPLLPASTAISSAGSEEGAAAADMGACEVGGDAAAASLGSATLGCGRLGSSRLFVGGRRESVPPDFSCCAGRLVPVAAGGGEEGEGGPGAAFGGEPGGGPGGGPGSGPGAGLEGAPATVLSAAVPGGSGCRFSGLATASRAVAAGFCAGCSAAFAAAAALKSCAASDASCLYPANMQPGLLAFAPYVAGPGRLKPGQAAIVSGLLRTLQ